MVESEVYDPEGCSQDDGGDHHQEGRALQFLPSRPGGLLEELYIALFQIVDKLSHLLPLMDPAGWKLWWDLLNNYQIVTFDIICRGSRIRTHIDGFGDR